MRCRHCNSLVVWKAGAGYVHPGGGLYVVYCPVCQWRSDAADDQRRVHCPICGVGGKSATSM
jgi:hypothetical protein